MQIDKYLWSLHELTKEEFFLLSRWLTIQPEIRELWKSFLFSAQRKQHIGLWLQKKSLPNFFSRCIQKMPNKNVFREKYYKNTNKGNCYDTTKNYSKIYSFLLSSNKILLTINNTSNIKLHSFLFIILLHVIQKASLKYSNLLVGWQKPQTIYVKFIFFKHKKTLLTIHNLQSNEMQIVHRKSPTKNYFSPGLKQQAAFFYCLKF